MSRISIPQLEAFYWTAELGSVLKAIEAHGGRIASRPYRIEGVGDLAYFHDTEGNRAGVMQYEGGLDWDQQ